jgi:hypothetical protein
MIFKRAFLFGEIDFKNFTSTLKKDSRHKTQSAEEQGAGCMYSTSGLGARGTTEDCKAGRPLVDCRSPWFSSDLQMNNKMVFSAFVFIIIVSY